MIEVKDQRSVDQQIRDNLESAENSLVITSDMISDKESYNKLINIIGEVRELKISLGGK